jgi:hypothetical protein
MRRSTVLSLPFQLEFPGFEKKSCIVKTKAGFTFLLKKVMNLLVLFCLVLQNFTHSNPGKGMLSFLRSNYYGPPKKYITLICHSYAF